MMNLKPDEILLLLKMEEQMLDFKKTINVILALLIIIMIMVLSISVITYINYNNINYLTNESVKEDVQLVHGVVGDMSLGLDGVPTEYYVVDALEVCGTLDNETYGITEDCIIIQEYADANGIS